MLFAPASDRAGRRILMRGGHDLISADRGDAWPRRRVFAVPPPPAPSVSTALQLRLSQYPTAAQQFSCLDQPATIVPLGHVVRDRQWWRSRAGTVFVLSACEYRSCVTQQRVGAATGDVLAGTRCYSGFTWRRNADARSRAAHDRPPRWPSPVPATEAR